MSEQQLNSLERFRKQSPHLLLEEHDSCEVPAGCGGVVIRWRNPHTARPVRFHVYTAAPSASWLDGQPLERGCVDLRPGQHVLALAIEEVERTAGLLMAALLDDPQHATRQVPPGVAETLLRVVSAADRTWKVRFEPPPDGWSSLAFDDTAWEVLDAVVTIPEVEWRQRGSYQWHACNREGAAGLTVQAVPAGVAPRGPAWARKVFEVPVPSTP